jgi:hypothetical protein
MCARALHTQIQGEEQIQGGEQPHMYGALHMCTYGAAPYVHMPGRPLALYTVPTDTRTRTRKCTRTPTHTHLPPLPTPRLPYPLPPPSL